MEKSKMRKAKGNEQYQKVAFIALRNDNGGIFLDVPLYVKVSEVTTNGTTESHEQLLHRISAVMLRRYERQVNEYFTEIKKEQNR